MQTAFLYDPQFLDHDTGHAHPESSARLSTTLEHLQKQPWFDQLINTNPVAADKEWLQLIHDANYIDRVSAVCLSGASYLDVTDVGISRRSYDVALLAAGGALVLGDKVMSGEADNGFALLRPPGHHAERNMALGFCLFNNIAILARYLQKQHGLDKILILDWDVHHGNGTQHAFEADPSVYYISLHQYPFYPGTGSASETGTGRGRGTILNCPMPAGATDTEYRQVLTEKVLPAVERFRPEAFLVSAGFDAHRDDPLATMSLSTEFYGWMTERVMEQADQYAGGRIVSLLEGGYNLKALRECVAVHLHTLGGCHTDPTYP